LKVKSVGAKPGLMSRTSSGAWRAQLLTAALHVTLYQETITQLYTLHSTGVKQDSIPQTTGRYFRLPKR